MNLAELTAFDQFGQPYRFVSWGIHDVRESLDALDDLTCEFKGFDVVFVSDLLSAGNMIDLIWHVNGNF